MKERRLINLFFLSLIFLGCADDTGYVPGSILAAQEEKEREEEEKRKEEEAIQEKRRKEEEARQEKRQDAITLINDGKTVLEKVIVDINDMIALWNAVPNVERTKNRAELALVSLGTVDKKYTDASVLLDRAHTCENNHIASLRQIVNYCETCLNKFIDYLDDEEHDSLKLDDANQSLFQARREIDEYNDLPSCNQ